MKNKVNDDIEAENGAGKYSQPVHQEEVKRRLQQVKFKTKDTFDEEAMKP